jgi:hypothetical protein
MRRIVGVTLALLVAAGLATAGETKEAKGTVKAVAGNSITITDSAAKDWTFGIDKETTVIVSGGRHKMDKLKADGKPVTIDEFVKEKNNVIVNYVEKDGKTIAREVHVK